MAETAADRAAAIRSVLDAAAGEPNSVKEAALAAIPAPQGADIGWLWKALLVGLLLLLVIAVGAIVWTVLDGDDKTSADKLVTIFAALLTGTLGLFVTSPAEGSK
jgi:hypothetical protein